MPSFKFPTCSTPVKTRSAAPFAIPELDEDESFDLMQDWPSFESFKRPGLQPFGDDDSCDEWLLEDSPSFLSFKNPGLAPLGDDDSCDEWLLDDSPSYVLFKNGGKAARVVKTQTDDAADESLDLKNLSLGEDEDGDLLEDSPSFVLFKSTKGKYDVEVPLTVLPTPSLVAPLVVPQIVVVAPIEEQEESCDERHVGLFGRRILGRSERFSAAPVNEALAAEKLAAAALVDASKPKMQRLMSFWKIQEAGKA